MALSTSPCQTRGVYAIEVYISGFDLIFKVNRRYLSFVTRHSP